ncbi:MAG: oligopeptidase B, partial [Marinilabiliales bacterium]
MKNIKSIFLIFISLAVFSSCSENVNKKEDSKMKPPVAKKIPKELSIHGDTRIDPYYWLRERENPEVIAYLEAENKYTEYCIKDYDSLKDQLYHEMIGRIKQEDVSAPYFNNGYFYYTRYEKNKEYEIECRKKDSLENTEEVIFDVNNMAVGYEYYALGDFSVSPDNKLAAFSFDTVSRRQYIIKVKNLENGEILSDIIDNTEGDIVWANDNNTFFYVEKDPVTLRGFRVKKHKLGTLSSEDQTVFEENDETFDVYIEKTKDNAFLLIGSNSTMADEYRYVDADQPDDTFKVIQPRERGIEYSVYHHSDYFYIRTNYEAQNFRLMKVPTAGKLSKENWIEVIPHRDSVLLEGIEV